MREAKQSGILLRPIDFLVSSKSYEKLIKLIVNLMVTFRAIKLRSKIRGVNNLGRGKIGRERKRPRSFEVIIS